MPLTTTERDVSGRELTAQPDARRYEVQRGLWHQRKHARPASEPVIYEDVRSGVTD
ncbi:TPA: hypothetical protein IOH10_004295 [Salmonella enterica]|nr:hypothetical protein [Salmonella enterica]HAO3760580.1 hypothetical protein [Salmonella enterica]